MVPSQMMVVADLIASDVIKFAREHDISPRDAVMTMAIAGRIVQKALHGSDLVEILQEADATFVAATTIAGDN